METANAIIQHSGFIISWCLSIIGGSILVIMGTEYVRPVNEKIRLIYVLFVPGWLSLGYTIKLGIKIANYQIMAILMQKNNSKLLIILTNMGNDYNNQLHYFNLGLAFFGIWLLTFLFFWIIGKV